MQQSQLPPQDLENHPWHNNPLSSLDTLPTEALLNLYAVLMSTLKSRECHISATWGDGEQRFSPSLGITLEIYCDLLDTGALRFTPQYWSQLSDSTEQSEVDLVHMEKAVFEVNIERSSSHSNVCKTIKKEIFSRIKAEKTCPNQVLNAGRY
jgi:hypothetical protein